MHGVANERARHQALDQSEIRHEIWVFLIKFAGSQKSKLKPLPKKQAVDSVFRLKNTMKYSVDFSILTKDFLK